MKTTLRGHPSCRMGWPLGVFSRAFAAIAVTGCAGTLAQIILMRELLVLFYGNELSTGVVLAGWLLWSALGSWLSGRWWSRRTASLATVSALLVLLAVLLPADILLTRGARLLWSIPRGQWVPPDKMLLIGLVVTGCFCPVSGALFGTCWAVHGARGGGQTSSGPLAIYLGEALGAALGGLLFYFIVLPSVPVLSAAWTTSLLVMGVSGLFLFLDRSGGRRKAAKVLWAVVSAALAMGAFLAGDVERMTRRWQWGGRVAAVEDTPYQNLALLREGAQFSLFGNGLWLFSYPDRLSAENAVHPALLQHPAPRTVLVLGGGVAGHPREILKHPHVERIDYVEPDSHLVAFAESRLPAEIGDALQDPRVRVVHKDPGAYLYGCGQRYDVVLLHVGDPVNAQTNRFYTREFFERVRGVLGPGGVFSFAVSGGQEMLGPNQARFLRSFQKTLQEVFQKVLIYPGDDARFLATDGTGELLVAVGRITARMAERGLNLAHIRQDTLLNLLSPFRLDYLESVLQQVAEPPINRDFAPTCYFHGLLLWSMQWHPFLQRLLAALGSIPQYVLWMGFALLGTALVGYFGLGRGRFDAALGGSVAVVGGVQMVVQIVLLLAFQIFAGFVYTLLALIIAFFMAGLASGALLMGRLRHRVERWALLLFLLIQGLLCLFVPGLLLFFFLVRSPHGWNLFSGILGTVFPCLSFLTGLLGGVHFSLAALVKAEGKQRSAKVGGTLYALDLAGSALGALLASLFLLPVYGLVTTMILAAGVCFLSWLTLAAAARKCAPTLGSG